MMTQAEESRLIRLAASGDRSAAEALVRAHQAGLYGYLYRMCGSAHLAEDLAQEALVRALTHLDRFDGRFRFSTWLFTIGKRLMLNELQRRRPINDADAPSAWGERGVAAGTPADSAAEHDESTGRQGALRRALMTLSAEQREVVVLFHMLAWPIAIIATHMGMPEGTVKSHLHRARERLRAVVGVTLSATPAAEVKVTRSGAGSPGIGAPMASGQRLAEPEGTR